ncbi:pseudouridine synthase [Alkalimarinus alittae]|uniref:tRNA pseudouridine synthase C n=1 Tax=Alkalimarinus alittae TaxID=2961619 RepID=A0ABY6MYB4_9ALTE|nr:pseudouridine synthase [Alkalimarinus alittae]UZE94772.1 pseudouridine synthase [Alkalimarinus alittae]
MEQEKLDIIYKDQHIIAINKPSGLLVHKSPIDKHETRYAMKILRNQIGQWVYPVHRLDKPTSGLLLFALSPEIAKNLGEQFTNNSVRKMYIAVVRGHTPLGGIIRHPIKETAMFKHQKKLVEQRAPQDALTLFRQLATTERPYSIDRYPSTRYSLIAAYPKTGRTHQIRKHLKHISHPIIGDAKHGKGNLNRAFSEHHDSHRLLLASVALTFLHPVTNKCIHLKAPLQDDFKKTLNSLGWDEHYIPNWVPNITPNLK